MPVLKYEEGRDRSLPNPLIHFDGYEKGLPVLTNKSITPKDELFLNETTPIIDILDYDETNRMTQKDFGKRWIRNAKINAKNYPDMGNNNSLAKYHNKLSGKPSILIGAGPSLAKNIDLLRDTDVTTFAMMHALPYLEKRGVVPDFVVHVDAMATDREFITESSKDITLIAVSYIAPSVLRKWKGDVSFFSTIASSPLTDRLDSYSTSDTTLKPMACSIASAMEIADELMDSNQIIFIGSDLCYSNNDETHVWDGLKYNTNERAGVRTILLDDGSGVRYNSCYQFLLYRNSIQNYIQHRTTFTPHRRYINATEGDILILPETMTFTKPIKSVADTIKTINAA